MSACCTVFYDQIVKHSMCSLAKKIKHPLILIRLVQFKARLLSSAIGRALTPRVACGTAIGWNNKPLLPFGLLVKTRLVIGSQSSQSNVHFRLKNRCITVLTGWSRSTVAKEILDNADSGKVSHLTWKTVDCFIQRVQYIYIYIYVYCIQIEEWILCVNVNSC